MFCKLLKIPYSILYSPNNLYSLSNIWLILSTQHPFRCEGCIRTEQQAIGPQVWSAGSPPEDKKMNHKQKMESSIMFHVTLFLERTGRRKSIKRTESHHKSYFFILVLLWWSRTEPWESLKDQEHRYHLNLNCNPQTLQLIHTGHATEILIHLVVWNTFPTHLAITASTCISTIRLFGTPFQHTWRLLLQLADFYFS